MMKPTAMRRRLFALILQAHGLSAPNQTTRHVVMSPEAASVWGEAAAAVEEQYPAPSASSKVKRPVDFSRFLRRFKAFWWHFPWRSR